MQDTALILGASGRFGRHAAQAFARAGWAVRRFDRSRDNLWDAASGAQVIVNAWNPPYPRWSREVPAMTRQLIEVAEASGATVVIPGNVYPYGANAPARLSADTPHAARNPLGRIRAEMEAAWQESRARVVILRGGDFIDTAPSGNWFDKIMTAHLDACRFVYPGPLDRPHAWAYLPDMARAAVGLAEQRDRLERFADMPFAGYTLTGQQMADTLQQVLGRTVSVRRLSWLPLRVAAPVWPTGRALVEMRYLWSMPHCLDGSALQDALPGFAETPIEMALASAIQHQVHPDKPMPRGKAGAIQPGTV